MRYAILDENNNVINLVESNIAINTNSVPILETLDVQIGDFWNGQLFYSPEKEIRMTADTRYVYNLLNEMIRGIKDA